MIIFGAMWSEVEICCHDSETPEKRFVSTSRWLSLSVVDDFYRNFMGGRYYADFRMEVNAAIKQGVLQ